MASDSGDHGTGGRAVMPRRSVTVGSLFTGIGGLDLGLEAAGMTLAWQSEKDEFCCQVLAKHWPDVPNLGDVTTIDWKKVPRVDLICGGYPCQPFSYSGLRRGGADERHLWPFMFDAIRHLRPRFALMENVPGHLSLGFGRVLGDLAEIGYDAEWDCIPAASIGAPHLRDRVWIVAYPHGLAGPEEGAREGRPEPVDQPGPIERAERLRGGREARLDPDADTERLQAGGLPEVGGWARPHTDGMGPRIFGGSLQPGGDWLPEPDVGRVVDGAAWRLDGPERLKALGNMVVPRVAEYVGRRIMEAA